MQEMIYSLLGIFFLFRKKGLKHGVLQLREEKLRNHRLGANLEAVLLEISENQEHLRFVNSCLIYSHHKSNYFDIILEHAIVNITELVICGQCYHGDILILENEILSGLEPNSELAIRLSKLIDELKSIEHDIV